MGSTGSMDVQDDVSDMVQVAQHFAGVDPDADPYDPRKPEYLVRASAEDITAAKRALLEKQLQCLEARVRTAETFVDKESQAGIVSHYRALIGELQCAATTAAPAPKYFTESHCESMSVRSQGSWNKQGDSLPNLLRSFPTTRKSLHKGCGDEGDEWGDAISDRRSQTIRLTRPSRRMFGACVVFSARVCDPSFRSLQFCVRFRCQ